MNTEIFYFFNNLAGKSIAFDTLVVFFASHLQYILVAGLVTLLVLGKDKKQEIKNLILVVVSIFVSRAVITEAIRYIYPYQRPFVSNDVYALLTPSVTYSFPSGHAAFFFALAAAVYFFHKKWSAVFFAGAILISLARVVAGVHWPADILAGAVVGILSAWAVGKGVEKYYRIS